MLGFLIGRDYDPASDADQLAEGKPGMKALEAVVPVSAPADDQVAQPKPDVGTDVVSGSEVSQKVPDSDVKGADLEVLVAESEATPEKPESESSRREFWELWQKDMNKVYGNTYYFDRTSDSLDARVMAWSDFIEKFPEDNPFTDRDEMLRRSATAALGRLQQEANAQAPDETAEAESDASVTPGEPFRLELPQDQSIDMLWIPAGTFLMGSPTGEEGREKNEQQHRVTLSKGFWMGKYEVTQGEWQSIMGHNPSEFRGAGLDAPVEQVSWEDAMKFCEKLTTREREAGRLPKGYVYSLPTEAQWEYACRAGTGGAFNWGQNFEPGMSNVENFDEHHTGQNVAVFSDRDLPVGSTMAVGMFPPNQWGLHDMHGNVWEWCFDYYDDYPNQTVADPTGPESGHHRVRRGGSWLSYERFSRSAFRYKGRPTFLLRNVGFRLALVPER